MNVLIACEFSGIVRDAFRRLGHNAWSCDLLPCEGDSRWHHVGSVLPLLYPHHRSKLYSPHSYEQMLWDVRWDMMIAHPPCTRLANSGVRWLHKPPNGKTMARIWRELDDGAAFYKMLRDAPVLLKAIENPIMHKHARERIGMGHRQIVQPWWFGDKAFKATGLELIGLPDLVPTNKLAPPKKGTDEHKAWSAVHRASPGPKRWKIRSKTFQGIAEAMAQQWGGVLPGERKGEG